MPTATVPPSPPPQGGVRTARSAATAITVLGRDTADCRLTFIARLRAAPFPWDGVVPADPAAGGDGLAARPFYDTVDPHTGERLHTTPDRNRYSERASYSSDRVLFHVPPGFDPQRPFAILVWFHGHLSELERSVVGEIGVPRQVNASGANVILIAPQLALNAIDSSPGKLYEPGGFAALLAEAAGVLAANLDIADATALAAALGAAPVIVAAYSGGYLAAAFALDQGGLDHRIAGLILLDAVYGEVGRFAAWASRARDSAFLAALYSADSAALTEDLAVALIGRALRVERRWPQRLTPGSAYFVRVATGHFELPTQGPPPNPLASALAGTVFGPLAVTGAAEIGKTP